MTRNIQWNCDFTAHR